MHRRVRILAVMLSAALATGAVVGIGLTVLPDAPALMEVRGQTVVPVTGFAVKGRPGPEWDTPTTPVMARGKPAVVRSASGEVQQSAQTGPPPLPRLPAYDVQQVGKVLKKLPPKPVPGTPFTFGIGTLNILGSQHRGGGTSRAGALAGAIQSRGVDLVGLQEVQRDQLAVLQSRLGGYTIWPGLGLGNQGVRLQIAWSDSLFELVDTGSIITTFDNQQRPIPYVLLRHRDSRQEFYVIDIHNSPRGQESARDAATGAQIALINQLQAAGKPVFILGDTNEKTEFFCRVAASTGMIASNGGYYSGGCSVGAGPIKIDWILGSGRIDFSGHVVDYGPPVSASTDHAFVHADVTITPFVLPAD